jgi:hypothetical protein
MKNQFNKHVRKNPTWNVGDEVWLSSWNILTTRPCTKWDDRWLGPFPISRVILPSAYELTLPVSFRGVHPVFHVSILRKHKPDPIEGRHPTPPDPITIENERDWEVEDILDCRIRGKRWEYLVSWKGFGPQANTWEPDENLRNCRETIDNFDKRFPTATLDHRRHRRKRKQ